MRTTSPIVDCGVHYVDVMCQITDAAAGRGPRHGPAPLATEIAPDMYNYGHFQVLFADGSLGWYEAGWGPMMSDTAFFVKDVVSPNGAVSIRMPETARSDDIDTHTRTSLIRLHRIGRARPGLSAWPTSPATRTSATARPPSSPARSPRISTSPATSQDAVASLRVCLAADESVRTGHPVKL